MSPVCMAARVVQVAVARVAVMGPPSGMRMMGGGLLMAVLSGGVAVMPMRTGLMAWAVMLRSVWVMPVGSGSGR